MTDQYSSLDFLNIAGRVPKWIADQYEARRVAAYGIYEDIYWNQPETFVLKRNADSRPIYLPSGKTIVETFNRYLATGMDMVVNPEFGTPGDQELAAQMVNDVMTRERFRSSFNRAKRGGVIRGDWAFHVYADPDRPPGSRVSVYSVHPGTLFPIYSEANVDIVIGWHIAEAIIGDDDEVYISRRTYRKTTEAEGPSPITYEHVLADVENWGGPGNDPAEIKITQTVTPVTQLPPLIDHIPIYHIPNFDDEGTLWGSSEMRGIETLFYGMHQAATDEDIALALDGLGLYWTDGGTPIDENGDEVPWNLGPGKVLELAKGSKMGRLNGLNSVEPYQSHVDWLQRWAERGKGISDTATGQSVDVQQVESGVALAMRMAPIISSAEERDQIAGDVLRNLFHDLKKWYAEFEDSGFASLVDNAVIEPVFGPKLPENKKETIDNLLAGHAAGIIPASFVRDELRRLGMPLPPEAEVISALTTEQTAKAQIQSDVTGARIDQEEENFL